MDIAAIYDTVIIGGSYSGLSAAMTLGRSLRKVLVIDGGQPCNRFAPHSHNFITQDGQPPAAIAAAAKEQVLAYATVSWLDDLVVTTTRGEDRYSLTTKAGKRFTTRTILLATGIKDELPAIPGMTDCWGKSAIHCPFCHGYEVRGEQTAVLANGEMAMHRTGLIANWTDDLVLLTNGPAEFSAGQRKLLEQKGVAIYETPVTALQHTNGYLEQVHFADGSSAAFTAMYVLPGISLPTDVAQQLGCVLTEAGLIQVNEMQATTVPGVFAAGDCTNPMRSVAMAVAGGTMAGAAIVHRLVFEAGE